MGSKTVGLVLAVVTLVAMLLASCSSAPTSPAKSEATSTSPTATTSSPKPAASPTATKPSGSVTVQANFGMDYSIDPADGTAATFQTAAIAIFDSLLELSSEGKMRPGIAERWEIAPDGKTHTFYIRKGVKFHDGSDLTGADVKFSIERILDPKATHLDAPTWRQLVASVELKDNYTVAVNLKTPQFDPLKGVVIGGVSAIVPKVYIEKNGVDYFKKNPVGSGPWKFVSYEPGNKLVLEAVESHWRAVPKFKTLTQLNVGEEGTKAAMLKTGELDLATVMPDQVAELKAAGIRIKGYISGGQSFAYLWHDLSNPAKYPFGDVKVRKALSLAVNRKEMSDKLLAGYAEPAALWRAPKTADFFDPNVLKADPYDPEGAKKLLAEAGYANGFGGVKIWTRTGVDHATHNQAIGGYWQKIGVNTDIANIDSAAMMAQFRPVVKPELYNTAFIVFSQAGGTLGFEMMAQGHHSTLSSPKNHNNTKLDELIEKVPTLKDPVEKKKVALEAAVMAKDQYSSLAFLELPQILAMGPKIGDVTPTLSIGAIASSYETITRAK